MNFVCNVSGNNEFYEADGKGVKVKNPQNNLIELVVLFLHFPEFNGRNALKFG